MITTQTVRAVLASNRFIPVELHENAHNDIVVPMAFEPIERGDAPLLQWLPINMPAGQHGLTACQALQQAWTKVHGVALHHKETIVGLEIDSYALLSEADVLAITGQLPITRI